MPQNLGAEIAETTVSENRDDFAASQRNLLSDTTGGGDRFHKNSFCIADVIGDGVQISLGHDHRIRERPVMRDDADHCAIRTVIG